MKNNNIKSFKELTNEIEILQQKYDSNEDKNYKTYLDNIYDLITNLNLIKFENETNPSTEIISLFEFIQKWTSRGIEYLYLKLVINIEKGNKLNKHYSHIISYISTKIDKKLENKTDAEILERLIQERSPNEIEEIFSKLDLSIRKLNKKDEVNEIIINVYIKILIANIEKLSFQEKLINLESLLIQYFIGEEDIKIKDFQFRGILKIVGEKFSKKDLDKISYPHLKLKNNSLKRQNERLILENEKLHELVSKFKKENEIYQFKLSNNERLHESLFGNIETLKNEKKQLEEQLLKNNDKLEFEINKYQIQLDLLRKGIISKVKKDLQLQINSLNSISNRLNEKDKDSLQMVISNINSLLNI